MSDSSKYQQLKSYLQTHYTFHANLGQYNLGDREQLETEAKWRMISDIMDYVDNLDTEESKSNVIEFPNYSELIHYDFDPISSFSSEDELIFGADSVPFYGTSGSDIISFDVDDDK